jgi:hypothetical protein
LLALAAATAAILRTFRIAQIDPRKPFARSETLFSDE